MRTRLKTHTNSHLHYLRTRFSYSCFTKTNTTGTRPRVVRWWGFWRGGRDLYQDTLKSFWRDWEKQSTLAVLPRTEPPTPLCQPQTDATFSFFWRNSPQLARASSIMRFLIHTHRCTTVSRTLLDEWSARRKDLYLTTHNTHNRHPIPRRPRGGVEV
jgi:hypothetical protein